jgi:hypothetical protein
VTQDKAGGKSGGEKIPLMDAYVRYHVPVPTLRFWLDKQELTRYFDDKRRVVLDVAELEERLKTWHPKTNPGAAA